MKKYLLWYARLSDGKKLAIQFFVQLFYWHLAWVLFAKIFPLEEHIAFLKFIIRATLMASFMTASLHGDKLKKLFRRQANE